MKPMKFSESFEQYAEGSTYPSGKLWSATAVQTPTITIPSLRTYD